MAIKFKLRWKSERAEGPNVNSAEILVSDEDASLLRQGVPWRVHGGRVVRGNPEVSLARLITQAGPDEVVVHRNGNTLDVRRSNLVVVSAKARQQMGRDTQRARAA